MLAHTNFLTVFLRSENIKATKVEGALQVLLNEYPVIRTKKNRSDKEMDGNMKWAKKNTDK